MLPILPGDLGRARPEHRSHTITQQAAAAHCFTDISLLAARVVPCLERTIRRWTSRARARIGYSVSSTRATAGVLRDGPRYRVWPAPRSATACVLHTGRRLGCS